MIATARVQGRRGATGVIGIDPKTSIQSRRAHSGGARLRIRNRLVALTTAIVLAVPATAAAAGTSPADTQYFSGPSAGVGGHTPSASSTSSGSLPFTGFDAGVLAVVGVGLVASGALLHRRQRTSREQT